MTEWNVECRPSIDKIVIVLRLDKTVGEGYYHANEYWHVYGRGREDILGWIHKPILPEEPKPYEPDWKYLHEVAEDGTRADLVDICDAILWAKMQIEQLKDKIDA